MFQIHYTAIMSPGNKFWNSRSLNPSSQVRLTVPMEAELPSLLVSSVLPKELVWVSVPKNQHSDVAGGDFRPHTTSGFPGGSRACAPCARAGLALMELACAAAAAITSQHRDKKHWMWQESLQLWQRSPWCPAAGMLAESAVKLSDARSVIPLTRFSQEEFF